MNLKRLSLLVTLSMMIHSISAQSEWFPVGAEWYYTLGSISSPSVSFFTAEISGDTIIKNQEARIFSIGPRKDFVHSEDNDKVYRYDKDLDQWFLLYDFTAEAGDTLNIHFVDSFFFEIVIDSVTTIVIEDDTFEVQYITQTNNGNIITAWGGRNIKFLGNDRFLFPQSALLDPPSGPLRCYSPSQEKTYSIVPYACDLVSTESINTLNKKIKIYPNPANDFLFITGLDIGLISPTVNIYNSYGQLVQSSQLFENRLQIEDLPIGLYFLSINSNQKLIFSQIFSKN